MTEEYKPPTDFEVNRFKVRADILQAKFAKAAIELMAHMNNQALILPIANTDPKLYICIGNVDDVVSMLMKTKPTIIQ